MEPRCLCVAAAASMLLACAAVRAGEPAVAGDAAWIVAKIEHEGVVESSGLALSRRHPDVLWTHNDGGNPPELFALTTSGAHLARFRVDDAPNVDWEDLASDAAGHLWLADFGNNKNDRRELRLYRLPEPDPFAGDAVVRPDRELRYRYADQTAYGDRDQYNFDAESLVWADGELFVFTKHRSDGFTTLYRLPDAATQEVVALEPAGSQDLGDRHPLTGNTTAADLSPDGRTLALLSYDGIRLFAWRGAETLASPPRHRIELSLGSQWQVESIVWQGDALLMGNEKRDLFRIPDPFGIDRYPPKFTPE